MNLRQFLSKIVDFYHSIKGRTSSDCQQTLTTILRISTQDVFHDQSRCRNPHRRRSSYLWKQILQRKLVFENKKLGCGLREACLTQLVLELAVLMMQSSMLWCSAAFSKWLIESRPRPQLFYIKRNIDTWRGRGGNNNQSHHKDTSKSRQINHHG